MPYTKLRLLLFSDCNRRCLGCCNQDWDLSTLPVCGSFAGYDEIMLTGGEPMLRPQFVLDVVTRIRQEYTGRLWVYTAKVDNITKTQDVLRKVDGLCVTLHEQSDVPAWARFASSCRDSSKSLRLNVFAGVDIGDIDTMGWIVKDGIKWIPNSPLPSGEAFMRLAPALL